MAETSLVKRILRAVGPAQRHVVVEGTADELFGKGVTQTSLGPEVSRLVATLHDSVRRAEYERRRTSDGGIEVYMLDGGDWHHSHMGPEYNSHLFRLTQNGNHILATIDTKNEGIIKSAQNVLALPWVAPTAGYSSPTEQSYWRVSADAQCGPFITGKLTTDARMLNETEAGARMLEALRLNLHREGSEEHISLRVNFPWKDGESFSVEASYACCRPSAIIAKGYVTGNEMHIAYAGSRDDTPLHFLRFDSLDNAVRALFPEKK